MCRARRRHACGYVRAAARCRRVAWERSCLPASPSPVPVPARRAARRGRPAGHCHGTPPTAAQAWQTPPLKQAAPFSKAPCVSAVACSLSQDQIRQSIYPSITPVLRPSHQMSTHELAPSLSCPAHLTQPSKSPWIMGSCPCPTLPYLACCSSSQAIVTAMQRGGRAMPRRRGTRHGKESASFQDVAGQGRRGYCTGAWGLPTSLLPPPSD